MPKPRFSLTDLLMWISLVGLIAAVVAPMYRLIRRNASGEFVEAIAISADGNTAAALFGDGTLRLWNTADGHLSATLKLAAGSESSMPYSGAGISVMAISADGKTIALALHRLGAPASAIELWDVAQQKTSCTLTAPLGCNVALAPEGDRVAWSASGAAGVYEPPPGALPSVALVGPPKWSPTEFWYAPVFSPDGQLLALANGSGKILLFETATRRMQVELDTRLRYSQHWMAFSGDGSKLIATCGSSYCEFQTDARVGNIWDYTNARRRSAAVSGLQLATSVALLPDDRTLAVSEIGTLHFVDLQTRKTHEAGRAEHVAAAPEGNVLVTSDGDRVDLWDAARRTVRQSLWGQSLGVHPTFLFTAFMLWLLIFSLRKGQRRLRPCAVCGRLFAPDKKHDEIRECEKCLQRARERGMSTPERRREPWIRRLSNLLLLSFFLLALYYIRAHLWWIVSSVLSLAFLLGALIAFPLLKQYIRRKRTISERYDLRLAEQCAGACGDVRHIAGLVVWSAVPSKLVDDLDPQVELCRQRLQAVLAQGVPPPDGARLLIFADHQQMAKYCRQLGQAIASEPRFNGVYLFAPLRRMVIAEPELLAQSPDPLVKLRSLILYRLVERCDPRLKQNWLTTGLAALLARNDGNDELARLGRRMKAAILAGRVLGPEELFLRRFGMTMLRLRRRGDLAMHVWGEQFPTQAWSFTEFLCGRGSTPERRAAFQQFWSDPRRLRQAATCLEQHYGLTVAELFCQWRTWVEGQEISEHKAPPAHLAGWMRRVPIATISNAAELPRNRIASIRHLGQLGFVLGTDRLIDVLRADDPLLHDEAVWALECISGEVHGSSAPAWEEWWRSLPESVRNGPTEDTTTEIITAELVDL